MTQWSECLHHMPVPIVLPDRYRATSGVDWEEEEAARAVLTQGTIRIIELHVYTFCLIPIALSYELGYSAKSVIGVT